MFANQCVTLKIVEGIRRETVRKTLTKNRFKPWREARQVLPLEAHAEFVCQKENNWSATSSSAIRPNAGVGQGHRLFQRRVRPARFERRPTILKPRELLVGRRGEAPLVPPYILPSFKKALAL